MTKSLTVLPKNGTGIQLLEQGAAAPLTLTDLNLSVGTLQSLTVICTALLSDWCMSSDQMFLNMSAAAHDAERLGIPDKEFKRVLTIIVNYWREKRLMNPAVTSGFIG
jgi:hypothetical protein